MAKSITRRTFVFGAALAAGMAMTPRARAVSPNEKLNIAHIGAGGRARGHVRYYCANETVVAFCDVDDDRASEAFTEFPKVPRFRDYRQMLEKQKDIDAVVIATPDHIHFVAAMTAMQLGKHVYVEKPMAHTIEEVWRMAEAAKRYKVATQMGHQGHSGEGVRQLCEMLWSGAIGAVKEVHCWTDRPIWPQGLSEPYPEKPVPPTLDWDLWLGPAPVRPYGGRFDRNPADPTQVQIGYAPFAWRGWWDFGCGAIGDMACHIMDPAHWALHLGAPTSVECMQQEGVSQQCAAKKSIIRFEFPEREHEGKKLPPVVLTWYDGNLQPPRPRDLPEAENFMSGNCSLLVGDGGFLVCGPYGDNARLLPGSRMADYKMPPQTIERIPGGDGDISVAHRNDFARACKGGKPACASFDYSARLTETALLGNIAVRAGQRILWNAEARKVTNVPDADHYVRCAYRKGWEIA